MNNGYVTFNDIIISLSHSLGRNNLRNEYPIIKRMIVDAEHEINPYAALLVKKRMTYHKGNGNFDGKHIVKPKDFFQIDEIGCCQDGLCPGQYLLLPTFITLCDGKKRDKVTFTYYGIACDGTGNPFTSVNHKEAILAYLEYMFYKPLMNSGKGNMNYYMALKREWEDRCMEARGEDFMREFLDNLDQLKSYTALSAGQIGAMESFEMNDSCECNACFAIDYDDNEFMNKKVYYWQFSSITENIVPENYVKESYLANKPNTDLQTFMNGNIISFTNIAKYAFCVDDVSSEDDIEIYDLTGSSLENTIDKHYDAETKRLVFTSKNLISHSSIYFKFKYNGR